MRADVAALFIVLLGWPAKLSGADPAVKNKKFQHAETGATISGRPPAVFWKRGMEKQPGTTICTPVEQAAQQPAARVVPPSPSAPESRQQVLQALATIQAGTPRSEVLRKLGPASYSIGMSEGEHYVERCRFRAGTENIASIEFRDGVVVSVDRLAR